MKKTLLLLVVLLLAVTTRAQINELQRSTPEAEGVPSKAILALLDSLTALPQTDIHSVMVLRHGKVIAEIYPTPFAPEYRHTVFSCSKTFVAAAVGLAIADNRLRLTDRVGSFFPELLPDTISANLAAMTVHDLLIMASGITTEWNLRTTCSDWIRTYLAKPVNTPGKLFDYDSMNTYLLSAIVQKVTGITLLDYLKQKLFAPMNITEVAWEISPEGITNGGWGLHIQSESMAKFGLLLLNQGVWEGKQLLPASWVAQMTTKQIETTHQDYSYQTWMCEYPGATCADGAFGQFILMIPDKDMVVVITECSLLNTNTQRRLVWNRLLPQVADKPLPPSKEYKLLQKKQHTYHLPLPQGKANAAVAQQYAGKRIALEKNKYNWHSLNLHFNPKEVILTVTTNTGDTYDLLFGYKQWLKTSTTAYPPYSLMQVDQFKGFEGPFWVAGSYAWPSPDALQLKAHYVNWVSALGLTFRIEGDNVLLNVTENYTSGNGVTIKGTLQ